MRGYGCAEPWEWRVWLFLAGREYIDRRIQGEAKTWNAPHGSVIRRAIDELVNSIAYAERADGHQFLVNRGVGRAARPVNICMNWLAGLKK